MSNTSDKSASSSEGGVPAMALMDINDDNVRTSRGDVPMGSSEVAPQSPPPPSNSMMGYVAKGIQDFLGATPSAQDMASADVIMESDQRLQASREVETAVHEDIPYHSRASSVFSERQDQQTRSM